MNRAVKLLITNSRGYFPCCRNVTLGNISPMFLHYATILVSSVFTPSFLMFETHVVCNSSSLRRQEALVRPTAGGWKGLLSVKLTQRE
jgi:hypothetical protein